MDYNIISRKITRDEAFFEVVFDDQEESTYEVYVSFEVYARDEDDASIDGMELTAYLAGVEVSLDASMYKEFLDQIEQDIGEYVQEHSYDIWMDQHIAAGEHAYDSWKDSQYEDGE